MTSTTVNPRILTMSDDAEEYFYEWYNGIIDAVNAIEDDADVESRKMKLKRPCSHVLPCCFR